MQEHWLELPKDCNVPAPTTSFNAYENRLEFVRNSHAPAPTKRLLTGFKTHELWFKTPWEFSCSQADDDDDSDGDDDKAHGPPDDRRLEAGWGVEWHRT